MDETTGACGINCMACRLVAMGRCSPCAPGTSPRAQQKLAAQLRAFGGYCLVLKCAADRGVGWCMRDCPQFPCENFSEGPYPYSESFLRMQLRRRSEP